MGCGPFWPETAWGGSGHPAEYSNHAVETGIQSMPRLSAKLQEIQILDIEGQDVRIWSPRASYYLSRLVISPVILSSHFGHFVNQVVSRIQLVSRIA